MLAHSPNCEQRKHQSISCSNRNFLGPQSPNGETHPTPRLRILFFGFISTTLRHGYNLWANKKNLK